MPASGQARRRTWRSHFRLATGISPMTNVPHKGGASALQDVLAGHVPFMFDTLVSSMEQTKSGNIRALGITSAGRWETLPDVPTIAESGYPAFGQSTHPNHQAKTRSQTEFFNRIDWLQPFGLGG